MRNRWFVIFTLAVLGFQSSAHADRGIGTTADAWTTLLGEYLHSVSEQITPKLQKLELGTDDIDSIVGDAAIFVTGCVVSKLSESTLMQMDKVIPTLAESKSLTDAIDKIRGEYRRKVADPINEAINLFEKEFVSAMLSDRKLD